MSTPIPHNSEVSHGHTINDIPYPSVPPPDLSDAITAVEGGVATTNSNVLKRSAFDKGDVEREGEVDETFSNRIERLGRQRPPLFPTIWSEMAFIFSINMSQILTEYFVSGFNVVLPTLISDLDISQKASVWPASAFSLVVASTLLVFGRLGDMYGGYSLYVFGMLWLTIWSVIAGFSQNPLMLILCRALQGLGPAAFLPAGVMLLGSVYRPGPRKNLVFSIYGACAVVGFFTGIFFAGIVGQYILWGWYFWIGAALTAVTLLTSSVSIPNDYAEKRKNGITMDWMGAALIVSGLILVVFAITDSSPVGWSTPYIPSTLALGVILLGLAVWVEGWVSPLPLVPFDMFNVPSMKPLIIALIFSYGCLGVWLLYATQYFQNCMGATPLQVVTWYTPTVLGGLILSTGGGFILHLIPGTGLLIFAGIGWIGSSLLLALIPHGASYWAFVLPSCILATIGIDITFSIVNIFVTTSMPSNRQGLAGAVLNSILHLGIALLLGFADIVQTATADKGLCRSYHDVFWYTVTAATVALIILVSFVRLDKAKSDLTADEKREQEKVEKEYEMASKLAQSTGSR